MNPNGSTEEGGEAYEQQVREQRCAASCWCDQVDAAAVGDAEAKLDDGGGTRRQGRREEEEEAKRRRGKREMTLGPIYKGKER